MLTALSVHPHGWDRWLALVRIACLREVGGWVVKYVWVRVSFSLSLLFSSHPPTHLIAS